MSLLNQLATALSNGSVEVIDLTHTLEERTPIIPLPEPNHQQWPFRMEEISRFDERAGLVLEQLQLRRTYWNALRRPHSLDFGPALRRWLG